MTLKERRTYSRIHAWLRNNYDKEGVCEFCESEERKTEFALIDGKEHAKNIDHYFELCRSCHRLYDWNDEKQVQLESIWKLPKLGARKPVVASVGEQIFGTYESLADASSKTDISITAISNCLTGRANTAGGLSWEYTKSR